MSESRKPRAKVSEIIMKITTPKGETKTINIDPNVTEALFWTENAVEKLLAPYYAGHHPEMDRDEFLKRFGKNAQRIIGDKPRIKIDNKLIIELWNLEDPDGYLPALRSKTNDCMPE